MIKNRLNNIKYLIIGIVLGSCVSGYADDIKDFVLSKVTYPLVVNGQKYQGELPILNLNGTTYIPLRVAGELLGTRINWNDSLKQVEIGGDIDPIVTSNPIVNDITNKIVSEVEVISAPIIKSNLKQEIKTYTIDNIEYVKIADIIYLHTSTKFNLFFKFNSETSTFDFGYSDSKIGDMTKFKSLLSNIPMDKIIEARPSIQYNYYINSIVPIINELIKKI